MVTSQRFFLPLKHMFHKFILVKKNLVTIYMHHSGSNIARPVLWKESQITRITLCPFKIRQPACRAMPHTRTFSSPLSTKTSSRFISDNIVPPSVCVCVCVCACVLQNSSVGLKIFTARLRLFALARKCPRHKEGASALYHAWKIDQVA